MKVEYVPRFKGKGENEVDELQSLQGINRRGRDIQVLPVIRGTYVNFKRDRNAPISELRRSERKFVG